MQKRSAASGLPVVEPIIYTFNLENQKMDMSLWTNRDQTVVHCHNCGVELNDDVEQITIGEFIKKLIVLGIGFGICSMLAYFMINVSCFQHEIPRLTASVLSLDAIRQPKRPWTSFCTGVCYIFRKESIMKIKLCLYSM